MMTIFVKFPATPQVVFPGHIANGCLFQVDHGRSGKSSPSNQIFVLKRTEDFATRKVFLASAAATASIFEVNVITTRMCEM